MVVSIRTVLGAGNGRLVAASRRKERINTEHTQGKRHREHIESFEWFWRLESGGWPAEAGWRLEGEEKKELMRQLDFTAGGLELAREIETALKDYFTCSEAKYLLRFLIRRSTVLFWLPSSHWKMGPQVGISEEP